MRVATSGRFAAANRGAGDGTRTHDTLLGKQTLYQLSYTRVCAVEAKDSRTTPRCPPVTDDGMARVRSDFFELWLTMSTKSRYTPARCSRGHSSDGRALQS